MTTKLHFDCASAGAAGDMILGALLDAGVPRQVFEEAFEQVGIGRQALQSSPTVKMGIAATNVKIIAKDDHGHRSLTTIAKIISTSELPGNVKSLAQKIFTRLGEAEAAIHNKSLDDIHFHEVGALDAIADIVGAAAAICHLSPDIISASSVALGTGSIKIAHGVVPLPAPATLRLLKGVPVTQTDVPHELCTPTGAAILTTVVNQWQPQDSIRPTAIGYGAGDRDLKDRPNVVRVTIGHEDTSPSERIAEVTTNLDDTTPEIIAHATEQLLGLGVLDVWTSPINMKKGRAGLLIGVLCQPSQIEAVAELLFAETSTIGIRYNIKSRVVMSRDNAEVETVWGTVRCKVSRYKDLVKGFPELEDCKKLAVENTVALTRVYDEAKRLIDSQLSNSVSH